MSEMGPDRHPYLRRGGPLALAHRGDRRRHPPGNTWPAFESAVELGIRYVETDVQASRDGVLVLFHDDRLDGATTGGGRIADHRWDELADVRYRRGAEVTGEGLVRLDDVLARWPDLRLNLDAKTEPTVAPLVQLLVRERALARACVASFDRGRLGRLRAQGGPELCTTLSRREVALLRAVSVAPDAVAGTARRWIAGQAAQVPVRHRGVTVVDRRFVDAAHGLGIDVHVWTVDDPDRMHALLDLGVDGLITDDPALLLQELARRDEESRRGRTGWRGA